MAALDMLSEDLRQHLLLTMYNMHPRERRWVHWVMSPEWWNDARKLTDQMGNSLWYPARSPDEPDCLMGKSVEIRPDGGVPHLEQSHGR